MKLRFLESVSTVNHGSYGANQVYEMPYGDRAAYLLYWAEALDYRGNAVDEWDLLDEDGNELTPEQYEARKAREAAEDAAELAAELAETTQETFEQIRDEVEPMIVEAKKEKKATRSRKGNKP